MMNQEGEGNKFARNSYFFISCFKSHTSVFSAKPSIRTSSIASNNSFLKAFNSFLLEYKFNFLPFTYYLEAEAANSETRSDTLDILEASAFNYQEISFN